MSSRGRRSEAGPIEAVGTGIPRSRTKGKVPEAVVSTRHGTELISRQGRGFSLGELSGAGLTPRLASESGVRVDVRRRSVLEGNVESLKAWGGHRAAAKKQVGRVKKVEEELEKVGKEVEKEAVKAEKEVVRVEKAAKKKVAKAEKAVKAKVEKPKAKPKKMAKS